MKRLTRTLTPWPLPYGLRRTHVFGILSIAWLLNGAALLASEFPAYPIQSADQCNLKSSKGGLRVGLTALESKKEQKTYLGTHLTRKGWVPVFVVLENESANSSFFVRMEDVSFSSLEETEATSASATASVKSPAGKTAILGRSLPALFVGMDVMAGASKIRQNIVRKQLRSLTLSPGKKSSGFLYVPIPDSKSKERGALKLLIRAQPTDAEQFLEYEFVF